MSPYIKRNTRSSRDVSPYQDQKRTFLTTREIPITQERNTCNSKEVCPLRKSKGDIPQRKRKTCNLREVCSLTLKNIKLTIEYDGTNYNGWQSQKNGTGIEDLIKKAIMSLTGESVNLIGSGRTDAGVHALGQVANFITQSSIPAEKFSFALNTKLPEDVVIKKSEEVNMNFHSRFSAKMKTYRYLIFNDIHPSALLRKRAYHVFYELNLDAMKQATSYFKGTHDFSGFMAKGSSVKTTVRTISDIKINEKGQLVEFEITGNGFLYNMVRIIAGTLVDVGIGKIPVEDIKEIIESCRREKAGRTLPPWGLYLVKVDYD